MPKKGELPPPVVLDYIDTDTLQALEYIKQMCESNNVQGMIFALALKDRKHPNLCGASGRLARNQTEAAGIAAMLQLKLTQEALDTALGQRK